MPWVRHLPCIWTLVFVTAIRADTPLDPLRLVPQGTDVFVKIERPRQLVEGVTHSEFFRELQNLDVIREAYDSTNARRFYQLVAYFEKQLGVDRFELIDRVAGGGAVLGAKIGMEPAPVLLVVQGKDAPLMQRFVKLAFDIVEQELVRQEAKTTLHYDKYRQIQVVHVGTDLHAAVIGAALLMSNAEPTLHSAINLHLDGPKKSLASLGYVADARQLAGADALAWMCLNLETIRKAPQAKEVFTEPRNDVNLTVLFGGILDVAGRAPFLTAGLYASANDLCLSFRMPRGREGQSPAITTHIPPSGQPGSRPLLVPNGVLLSSSYYLDLAKFWENRARLFNEKQRKAFEEFDKKSAPFLAGASFSKLTAQAGPYQRFVIVHEAQPEYKVVPEERIPAFGLVVEMREPEALRKKLEAIIRAGALLATTQVRLKPFDEQHGKYKIAGYRFPENGTFKPDTTNFRFNFCPCYAAVGNQFLACSSIALCREMVDLLDKEISASSAAGSAAASCTQVYARGATELLEEFKDRIFTQLMLNQALAPDKAHEQVKAAFDLLRQLGVFQIEGNFGARDFHYDLRLKFAK